MSFELSIGKKTSASYLFCVYMRIFPYTQSLFLSGKTCYREGGNGSGVSEVLRGTCVKSARASLPVADLVLCFVVRHFEKNCRIGGLFCQ